jgi:hypothetical protein
MYPRLLRYIAETLPTAAEVTSMAPSVTPNRTGVRIHMRCRIHARYRIDRIFINHHWRRRYNDSPANHDGLGNDGSRLLDNERRRTPVLVRVKFPLIAWYLAIARYDRQIGGHCRRRRASALAVAKIALRMDVFPLLFVALWRANAGTRCWVHGQRGAKSNQ